MSQPGDRRLPRAHRLRSSADFRRVNREGERLTVGPLIVRYHRNGLGHPRFGLAVSRRVGNAVVRNRVKRWIREAARHERGDLEGIDIVFIARPSAARAGHAGIRSAVATALDRIAGRGGEC